MRIMNHDFATPAEKLQGLIISSDSKGFGVFFLVFLAFLIVLDIFRGL
jgi:hypothetical protein